MAAFDDQKGLVGTIRAAVESDHYDLAGYNESRCRELIEKSFGTTLEAPEEMVKFTFTIGGGKLVRSRYDDSMSKWVVSALKNIGFNEDRSAACDFSCQGTYKQQHDTGQNLKTITIFPKVACADRSVDNCVKQEREEDLMSAKELALMTSDLATFKDIVTSKTSSWSQRKRMLKVLQAAEARFQGLEKKLVHGEMLSPAEQKFYDINTGNVNEKMTWLQKEIKAMVDKGNLTVSEKENLALSIQNNIDSLNSDIERCTPSGQEKKLPALIEKKEKMQSRLDSVRSINPITHRLRKASEIEKVWKLLHDIQLLEDKGRTMSLTLADLKKIEPKPELEQKLLMLQQSSRCWFEDDEEFELRCNTDMEVIKSKLSKKSLNGPQKKAGTGMTKGNVTNLSWNTRTTKQAARSTPAKPTPRAPSGGFAAAFGSDSDSDE